MPTFNSEVVTEWPISIQLVKFVNLTSIITYDGTDVPMGVESGNVQFTFMTQGVNDVMLRVVGGAGGSAKVESE